MLWDFVVGVCVLAVCAGALSLIGVIYVNVIRFFG